jgi:hypothetical protein
VYALFQKVHSQCFKLSWTRGDKKLSNVASFCWIQGSNKNATYIEGRLNVVIVV